MPAQFPNPLDASDEPSPHDLQEQMVTAGDAMGLMDSILTTPSFLLDVGESYRQLRRALDVASQRSPDNFAKQLFQGMTAFAANALLRVQIECLREMNSSDSMGASRGMPLSAEFLNHWLPLYQQLSTHLSDLLFAHASATRQWELVRRRQSPTQDTTSTAKQQKCSRRSKRTKFSTLNGFRNHSPY